MYDFDILTLMLATGRTIRLDRLFQKLTYEGMLAGLPHENLNAYFVENAKKRASDQSLLGAGAPVVQVPPRIEERGNPGELYPFLPAVECIGHFTSTPTAKREGIYRSSLTVVWFQPTFTPPIDGEVEQHISGLDWDQLAEDYDP